MRNHQQHERHDRDPSRDDGNWPHESRDRRGRLQSGNWGTSDSDGEYDDESRTHDGRDRNAGDADRFRHSSGRGREMMDQSRQNSEDYEADYGFPQMDRDARWNDSGRWNTHSRGRSPQRGDQRSGRSTWQDGNSPGPDRGMRDRSDGGYAGEQGEYGEDRDARPSGGYGSNNRGWGGTGGEETFRPRRRHGDDRSAQGGDRDAGERQARGPHAGKGPKGYRRSDERIAEDVNEALSRDGDVDASEIEVQVKDREVTLSGTVPDRATKRRAEECAEECSGVDQVHNNLRVAAGAKHQESADTSRSAGAKSGKQAGNGSAGSAAHANSTSGSASKHQSPSH